MKKIMLCQIVCNSSEKVGSPDTVLRWVVNWNV